MASAAPEPQSALSTYNYQSTTQGASDTSGTGVAANTYTPAQQALQQQLGNAYSQYVAGTVPSSFTAPQQVIDQWKREFNNFVTPGLSAQYGAGSPQIGEQQSFGLGHLLASLYGQGYSAYGNALGGASNFAMSPVGKTVQEDTSGTTNSSTNALGTSGNNYASVLSYLLGFVPGFFLGNGSPGGSSTSPLLNPITGGPVGVPETGQGYTPPGGSTGGQPGQSPGQQATPGTVQPKTNAQVQAELAASLPPKPEGATTYAFGAWRDAAGNPVTGGTSAVQEAANRGELVNADGTPFLYNINGQQMTQQQLNAYNQAQSQSNQGASTSVSGQVLPSSSMPTFGTQSAAANSQNSVDAWNAIAQRYDEIGMPTQAAMARSIANGTMNGGGLSNTARDLSWQNYGNNIWSNTAGLPSSVTGLINVSAPVGGGTTQQPELSGYEQANQAFNTMMDAYYADPTRGTAAGGNYGGSSSDVSGQLLGGSYTGGPVVTDYLYGIPQTNRLTGQVMGGYGGTPSDVSTIQGIASTPEQVRQGVFLGGVPYNPATSPYNGWTFNQTDMAGMGMVPVSGGISATGASATPLAMGFVADPTASLWY